MHYLAIQDRQRDRHPSKLEIFDRFFFIILRDLIRAEETHRLNVLQLSLVVGIYGMNFQFMPELSWHYGYFGVLAAMATIVIVLVIVFKRRDRL